MAGSAFSPVHEGILDAIGAALVDERNRFQLELDKHSAALADLHLQMTSALISARPAPQGKWEREKAYSPGDIVAWSGTSWFARRVTVAGEEPGESDAFVVIVTKPKAGKPGDRGPPGPPGKDASRIVDMQITGREAKLEFEDKRQISVDLTKVIQELAAQVMASPDLKKELVGIFRKHMKDER